jgi:FkbM family methyltransferase
MRKPLFKIWMSLIQQLSGSPLLRKSYEFLSRVPVFGPILRKFLRFALPSDTLVWAVIRSGPGKGLWIHLNPRFEMEYLEGNYEPTLWRVLQSQLTPGAVFYDVGAHIGLFSLIAARNLGVQGSVFVFEPDPSNIRRIEEHASRNRLDALGIIPKAAWFVDGRMKFQRACSQSSMNRGAIAEDNSAASESTIEVETVTLDSFGREHALPSIIKIDVEGSEAAVLRGSEGIFRFAKPVVICEIHHAQAASDVTHWLQARGYVFEWVEDHEQFPRHLFAKYVG